MRYPAMRTVWIACAILIAIAATAAANSAPDVTNVLAEQRSGTALVDIYYDVYDADGDLMAITAICSDGAGGWVSVTSTQQGSDIGPGIASGQGKHIVWDAGVGMPGHAGDDYVVRVTACDAVGCATLHFDGGDCALIPGDVSFDLQHVTVEAWVRLEQHQTYRVVLGTRVPGGSGDAYALWVKSTRLCFSVCPGSGQVDFSSGDPLPTEQWLHLAGSYDGEYIRLYLDGAIVDSTAWSGTLAPASAYPVTVGIDWDGGPHDGWLGDIEEVRVWSYARTAAELATSWSQPGIDADPRLVGRWKFEEEAGEQQVLDRSSYANDGCLGTTCDVDSRDPTRGGCP